MTPLERTLALHADDEFVCNVQLEVDSTPVYKDCRWSGVLTPLGDVNVHEISNLITDTRTPPIRFSLMDDQGSRFPVSTPSFADRPFTIQVKSDVTPPN